MFKRAERAEELPVGRPVTFGDKMALNQEASHFPEDISFSHTFQSKRKKLRIATIKIWKNMIFKGEKGFNSYDFPCLLIQIVVRNKLGNTVYKRPMWLSVYGAMRDEIMSELSTPLYFQRFDIEHFFRFGKQKLLLDSYQTPETLHGENMAEFTSLAYMQLFAAKDCAKEILYDWEKYQSKPEKTDVAMTLSWATLARFPRHAFSRFFLVVTSACEAPRHGQGPLERCLAALNRRSVPQGSFHPGECKKSYGGQ